MLGYNFGIMLKRLVIGLCLVIAPIGALALQKVSSNTPEQRVAKSNGSHKGEKQPEAQDSNNPSPRTLAASPQPSAPRADQPGQKSSEDSQIQRWLMYFTGALVVVGFLQMTIMGFQAWLLRLTWKTIERQTEAAARSAASFINKERSRLFVDADIGDDFLATVTAVNRGLSPARITYKLVGSKEFSGNLAAPIHSFQRVFRPKAKGRSRRPVLSLFLF